MEASCGRCLWPLFLVSLLALSSTAHATDGYFSHGYGTKSKALAGAGVAFPQDGLSAATNPAGLVLVGNRFEMGGAIFNPDRQYSVVGSPSRQPGTFGLMPGTVSSGNDSFGIPDLATTRRLTPNDSFGLAIYGNGGMNTTYPVAANNGAGTFYAGQAGVNLEQLFISPSYAHRFSDHWSAGISLIGAFQKFEARGLASFGQFVADGTPENLSNRGQDQAFGYGGRIGVLGQVSRKLSIGAAYQTQLKMGKFNKYSDLFAGQGSFDIPASATAGLAWKTSSSSVLLFDTQYIWYSAVHSIGNAFENLMEGAQGDTDCLLGGGNGCGFGWRDMTVYKLGYQWQSGQAWTLRTGVSYGRQPIPSSEVLFNILAPGVQEWHLTAGFTRKLGASREFSLALMYSPDKTVTGVNPLEAPGQQSISLKMHQFEAEASYAIRF